MFLEFFFVVVRIGFFDLVMDLFIVGFNGGFVVFGYNGGVVFGDVDVMGRIEVIYSGVF